MLKNVASRLPFSLNLCKKISHYVKDVVAVVVLLFYVHSKQLRSCWDGQFT